MSLSIILPAHNEAGYLADCLNALLTSDCADVQVIIVANACTDTTADVARSFAPKARALGWDWRVIETAEGGKLNALNLGDRAATGDIRIYLDADVVVSRDVLAQIGAALAHDAPGYACATPQVVAPRSAITRAYARLWVTLPFVTQGTPGFGLFAVNAAGRARWGDWPDIISDDTFARLNFTPAERRKVPATYTWPMVEGFANMVRVRRRQNHGVAEIAARFPVLLANEDTPRVGLGGALSRLAHDPLGFLTYVSVTLAVKTPLFASKNTWARGR